MKKTLVAVLIASIGGFGATTTIDFETENDGYTASSTHGSGDTDVFNRSNPNLGGNSSYIWSVEGINITDPTITLDQISISGATSFTFAIDMIAHHYLDWDTVDELLITYKIDGGSSQNLMWVQNIPDGDNFNSLAALDTDFDGDGECDQKLPSLTTGTNASCTVSSSSFETFETSPISISSNSTLDITLEFKGLTSGDEGIYLDNIEITTSSASVDNPTSFASTTPNSSQNNLSWTQNGDTDNVMVAWNSSATFGTPSGTYTVSDGIVGGGTVIFNADGTSHNHTGLDANTTYYYKAWSVDGSNDYSSGVTTNATTLKAEPTNHVTSFSASANGHNQIDLTWGDNDGSSTADGQLILINKTGTFSNPVDGTAQSNDTDVSDGSGAYNALSGDEAYSWTDLDAETQYYLKIFPYTNSGSNIDFKTDGTVPTDNATTGAAPAGPSYDVIVNEFSQGSSGSKEWIELLVVTDNMDLRGWDLGDNDDGSWHSGPTFSSSADWNNVSQGTIIVVYNNADIDGTIGSEDTDFSDKSVKVAANNSTYFSGSWGSFGNTDGDDLPAIRDADDTIVHDMAITHNTSTIDGPGSGEVTYYTSNTKSGVESNSNWTTATSTSGTPGSGNGGDNSNWVDNSLPVVLSSWKATSAKCVVKLHWITDSEIENQGFIIERSGGHLNKTWTELASFTTNPDLLGQGSTTNQNDYTFIDKQVKVGKTYSYRLSDVDYRGNVIQHAAISVTVKDAGMDLKPGDVKLHKAFPNPFNPDVNLSFTLENDAEALSLEIYDIQGALINTLGTGYHATGTHDFNWDGSDNRGNAVSSGVYIVRLNAESLVQIQRVTLLR
jgi:hypothetical protein